MRARMEGAMRDLYERTPIKLDPDGLGLTDPGELRLAHAIAEATEATREALRAREPWNTLLPPRGFQPAPRNAPAMMVDVVPWPSLLALGRGAEEVAQLCSIAREDVIAFAMRASGFDQLPVLILIDGGSPEEIRERTIKEIAKILSPVVQPMHRKLKNVKAGASKGGKEGAKRKKREALVPDRDVLLQQIDSLIAAGEEKTRVRGLLAERHGVSRSSIDKKLRRSSKK